LKADSYSPRRQERHHFTDDKILNRERKYSVPVECFRDLIVDLKRINTAASDALIKFRVRPASTPNRGDDQDRLMIAV
jgi:hypothetical protein